jgi:hypothetical protein
VQSANDRNRKKTASGLNRSRQVNGNKRKPERRDEEEWKSETEREKS